MSIRHIDPTSKNKLLPRSPNRADPQSKNHLDIDRRLLDLLSPGTAKSMGK
jgi:hypothetical protein